MEKKKQGRLEILRSPVKRKKKKAPFLRFPCPPIARRALSPRDLKKRNIASRLPSPSLPDSPQTAPPRSGSSADRHCPQPPWPLPISDPFPGSSLISILPDVDEKLSIRRLRGSVKICLRGIQRRMSMLAIQFKRL